MNIWYRTATGEIRYNTFRADPSTEDVTAINNASGDSSPSGVLDVSPSSSEGRLEYENVLEYRDINRHARRKIEAWINDGWRVSWEWNGLYNYSREKRAVDNRWVYDGPGATAHWMTLRKSRANLPLSGSTSHKRITLEFPKTPKPPRNLTL